MVLAIVVALLLAAVTAFLLRALRGAEHTVKSQGRLIAALKTANAEKDFAIECMRLDVRLLSMLAQSSRPDVEHEMRVH